MGKNIKALMEQGKAVLGIELGSTRIKAVLIDDDNHPILSSSHSWENRLENGVWTYHLEDVWSGLQDAYGGLVRQAQEQYGVTIKKLGAIGFSAMMHGYLVFDRNGSQLAPFRTWRNTITEQAARELTELFRFNIPQRWNIAHLYQAILNQEEHVKDIALLTTLAGYVHWKLTGEKVLGVGEASGVFPIDSTANDYDSRMLAAFDGLIREKGYPWNITEILPSVLTAGEPAGRLTEAGARLLDPTGNLQPGAPLCPPEGDAGTGMVATNSIAPKTGNISAGTSVFSMVVLEKPLSGIYPEIDLVTTPEGKPVAMVHCNNCTSDLDAWVRLFQELNGLTGAEISLPQLYDRLYEAALQGDKDCGGVLSYNYFSGEPVTGLSEGRPLLVRQPDSRFTLANFMRSQLFAAMATLRMGMDILFEREHAALSCLTGHGGLFKTKTVGQRLMAAAMNTPVAVMETAGEGGAWGIAVLASYLINRIEEQSLEDYLNRQVFSSCESTVINPDPEDVQGFAQYMKQYVSGLKIEKKAAECIR